MFRNYRGRTMSKKFLNAVIMILFIFFICYASFDFAYQNYIIGVSDAESGNTPSDYDHGLSE